MDGRQGLAAVGVVAGVWVVSAKHQPRVDPLARPAWEKCAGG